MDNHLKIKLVKTAEGFAYDVEILEENATVGQYIEALDAFLDAKVAPCLGCDNCCYQRIPLTLPDLYAYGGREKARVAAFLQDRVQIEKKGRALDLYLRRDAAEACTFLDRQQQRCLDHPHRSLVCHTYICLPQTARANALREFLINDGEDAAFGALFHWGLLEDFNACRESYPIKPAWQGKTHQEVLLKDVLPAKLWETLTSPLPW